MGGFSSVQAISSFKYILYFPSSHISLKKAKSIIIAKTSTEGKKGFDAGNCLVFL